MEFATMVGCGHSLLVFPTSSPWNSLWIKQEVMASDDGHPPQKGIEGISNPQQKPRSNLSMILCWQMCKSHCILIVCIPMPPAGRYFYPEVRAETKKLPASSQRMQSSHKSHVPQDLAPKNSCGPRSLQVKSCKLRPGKMGHLWST